MLLGQVPCKDSWSEASRLDLMSQQRHECNRKQGLSLGFCHGLLLPRSQPTPPFLQPGLGWCWWPLCLGQESLGAER